MIAVLLALSILPRESDVTTDRVEVVELNHFYDENGRLVFDQLIFWKWDHYTGRDQVVDWRLVKQPSHLPVKTKDGLYTTIWSVEYGSYAGLHVVKADHYRETWTQWDVELIEREQIPKEHRLGLSRPQWIARDWERRNAVR